MLMDMGKYHSCAELGTLLDACQHMAERLENPSSKTALPHRPIFQNNTTTTTGTHRKTTTLSPMQRDVPSQAMAMLRRLSSIACFPKIPARSKMLQ